MDMQCQHAPIGAASQLVGSGHSWNSFVPSICHNWSSYWTSESHLHASFKKFPCSQHLS